MRTSSFVATKMLTKIHDPMMPAICRKKLVTDRVPEIGFLGARNYPINVFKASWCGKQCFSSYFATFDDFSKFCSDFGTLHLENHQICQKIKKRLVQVALNPFLYGTSKTRNSGFGYPIAICHWKKHENFLSENVMMKYLFTRRGVGASSGFACCS